MENETMKSTMNKMDIIDKMDDLMPPPLPKTKKGKKGKNKKNVPDSVASISGASEMFNPISNPIKMMSSPLSSRAANDRNDDGAKKDKKDKKDKKKKKGKKYSSSISSSSSQSIDGFPQGFSDGGCSSITFDRSSGGSSSGSSRSETSSRYNERKEFTARKRHEEIMQEKFVMLTRISKMSRAGISARKKFTMKDDINDIRFECYRMTREKNSQSAIKTMHMVLITIATIVEKANGAFNPFNLNLSGFSQNMMLGVSDYDDSLEEIHHKWSGKTYMGPEMSIMFTFITSAIFFHVGNGGNSDTTSKKSSSMPPMMSLFSSMFGGSKKSSPPSVPATATPVSVPVDANVVKEATPAVPVSTLGSEPVVPKKRKTMKGPSSSPFAGLVPNVTIPSG